VRKIHGYQTSGGAVRTLAALVSPGSLACSTGDVGGSPGVTPSLFGQVLDVQLISPAQPQFSSPPNWSIAGPMYNGGVIEGQYTGIHPDLSGALVNSGPYLSGHGPGLSYINSLTNDTMSIMGHDESIDPSMSMSFTNSQTAPLLSSQDCLPNGQSLVHDQIPPQIGQATPLPHGVSTVYAGGKSIRVSNYDTAIDTMGLAFVSSFQGNYSQVGENVQGYSSPPIDKISAWDNTTGANSDGHHIAQPAEDFEDMIDWEGLSSGNAYI